MRVSHPRRGAVLVWFSTLLVVLFGFLGLVIDVGLLMASQRHAQNAADAAAMAGAHDLYQYRNQAQAILTAKDYACTHNAVVSRESVVVNIPPGVHPHRDGSAPCAYTGQSGYVEAIVSQPVGTFFIHLLPNVVQGSMVSARAIAGFERHSAGEGVMVLDPYAYPGLTVQGGGVLEVNGRVIVNSEGEGVGLNEADRLSFANELTNLASLQVNVDMSDPPDGDINDTSQPALTVTDSANLRARWLQIRGGVDVLENYFPYDPSISSSPLHTGQELEPDPLWDLATPMVSNGVDPTPRGVVAVNNQGISGQSVNYIVDNRDASVTPKITGDMGQNFIAAGGEELSDGGNLDHVAAEGEVILYPGLYDEISISDGDVFFVPGIYILTPKKQTTYALSVQGGQVTAEGVLFYNTANNYTAHNGMPDAGDVPALRVNEKVPPGKKNSYEPSLEELDSMGDYAGGFNVTSGMRLSPIDTSIETGYDYGNIYDYTPPSSGEYLYPLELSSPSLFEGMLVYQRRWNTSPILIRGNDMEGGSKMGGTLYAKWSRFDLSGQGIYDAQFIAGSMAIDGRANIRILATGDKWGLATKVYLVE